MKDITTINSTGSANHQIPTAASDSIDNVTDGKVTLAVEGKFALPVPLDGSRLREKSRPVLALVNLLNAKRRKFSKDGEEGLPQHSRLDENTKFIANQTLKHLK